MTRESVEVRVETTSSAGVVVLAFDAALGVDVEDFEVAAPMLVFL